MENLKQIVKTVYNKAEFIRILGLHENGSGYRKVNKIIKDNNLDIRHFKVPSIRNRKYKIEEKECPVCKKKFKVKKDSPREKTTCSHSCANVYFRSGKNNPNWKDGLKLDSRYRRLAFENYKHECYLCRFNKKYALVVHHIDENRNNNKLDNLIILCANCHYGVHYGDLKIENEL